MNIFEYKTRAWQPVGAAARYDQATRQAPHVFDLVRQRLYIEYVRKHAASAAKVLDVGCGSGLITMSLYDLGFSVVAYDASRDMLAYLDSQKGDRSIELRHGDGKVIPAADGEFDLTLSRMFIQHFADWPKILAEKARVTRKGGIVLFDFGNQEHLDLAMPRYDRGQGFPYDNDQTNVPAFYAVATARGMERQARSLGLEVVEIAPAGLLLYNGLLWNEKKASGIAEFNRRLDELLLKDGAVEMLMLIETEIMPKLPKEVSYGNITVLRKIA